MYNILIAEDSGALRGLLNTVLSALGYDVIVANDGMEALKAAKERKGPIDLLCANVSIPRIGGVVLAEKLKMDHPETKVLLLVTDNPWLISVEPVGDKEHHPEFAVLRKPFTVEDLTTKVKQLLSPAQAA